MTFLSNSYTLVRKAKVLNVDLKLADVSAFIMSASRPRRYSIPKHRYLKTHEIPCARSRLVFVLTPSGNESRYKDEADTKSYRFSKEPPRSCSQVNLPSFSMSIVCNVSCLLRPTGLYSSKGRARAIRWQVHPQAIIQRRSIRTRN
jgi:hypothetical protein